MNQINVKFNKVLVSGVIGLAVAFIGAITYSLINFILFSAMRKFFDLVKSQWDGKLKAKVNFFKIDEDEACSEIDIFYEKSGLVSPEHLKFKSTFVESSHFWFWVFKFLRVKYSIKFDPKYIQIVGQDFGNTNKVKVKKNQMILAPITLSREFDTKGIFYYSKFSIAPIGMVIGNTELKVSMCTCIPFLRLSSNFVEYNTVVVNLKEK